MVSPVIVVGVVVVRGIVGVVAGETSKVGVVVAEAELWEDTSSCCLVSATVAAAGVELDNESVLAKAVEEEIEEGAEARILGEFGEARSAGEVGEVEVGGEAEGEVTEAVRAGSKGSGESAVVLLLFLPLLVEDMDTAERERVELEPIEGECCSPLALNDRR